MAYFLDANNFLTRNKDKYFLKDGKQILKELANYINASKSINTTAQYNNIIKKIASLVKNIKILPKAKFPIYEKEMIPISESAPLTEKTPWGGVALKKVDVEKDYIKKLLVIGQYGVLGFEIHKLKHERLKILEGVCIVLYSNHNASDWKRGKVSIKIGVPGDRFEFLPKENSPVSRIELIPTQIERKGACFVIAVDPKLERQLGESGYVERRKMCEDSLSFWTKALGRGVKSLRDISIEDFASHKTKLEAINSTMRKRVEHVVFENNRVLDAVKAIRKNNIGRFGKLLSESGKSALELYELDENTPQLTHLVEKGRSLPGVLGMRNMGGGFSAIALALVEDDLIQSFQQRLNTSYQERFGNNLDFMQFEITNGVGVV